MSEDGNESSGSGGSGGERGSYDGGMGAEPSQPYSQGASLPVSIPGSEYRRCAQGPGLVV